MITQSFVILTLILFFQSREEKVNNQQEYQETYNRWALLSPRAQLCDIGQAFTLCCVRVCRITNQEARPLPHTSNSIPWTRNKLIIGVEKRCKKRDWQTPLQDQQSGQRVSFVHQRQGCPTDESTFTGYFNLWTDRNVTSSPRDSITALGWAPWIRRVEERTLTAHTHTGDNGITEKQSCGSTTSQTTRCP